MSGETVAKPFRYTGIEPLTGVSVQNAPCAFKPRPPVISGEQCFVCKGDCFQQLGEMLVSSTGILCDCAFYFHRCCVKTEKIDSIDVIRCPKCHQIVKKIEKYQFSNTPPLLTYDARVALFGKEEADKKRFAPFPSAREEWMLVAGAILYLIAVIPLTILIAIHIPRFEGPMLMIHIPAMLCGWFLYSVVQNYNVNRGTLKFA